VIFLFFSASSSKLASYILPIFPALALLTGDWLRRAQPRALRWHLAAVGLVAVLAVALLPRISGFSDTATPEEMIDSYARWLAVAAWVFALGAVIALWLNWRARRMQALALLAVAALFTGLTTLLGHEALGRSNSADYIAGQIRPYLAPGLPFYSVGMYEQTLPFYIERTVTLVDYQDEFAFGLEQEPQLSIPTFAEFKQRWLSEPAALAMFTREGFAAVQPEGLPMEVIAEDPRRIVVRKPGAKP
jgi:4-amino-4-deoxy-L-arabinose transferase-like glycosyltransferase